MSGKASKSKETNKSGYVKKEIYPYPSRYGSHNSMVVQDETSKLTNKDMVVCKDEHGKYITEKKYLDCGLADPYRIINTPDREKKFKLLRK